MKKILPLFAALLVFNVQNIFAGPNETKKAQFQFTTFEVTQNSWDYALLHYNINDLSTGETLEIPSFLINYEVKDRTGNTISKGSGLYVKVMDNKLGSEEDYTIIASTMINGQKISQVVCKKASPKKFAMKMDTHSADADAFAGGFTYSCTRPKFGNRAESENIDITASDVSVAVILDNCATCATYKINAGPNHQKFAEQADYRNLSKDIRKMTKDGQSVQLTMQPSIVFKGDSYLDNQSRYDVTASGISEIASTLEAIASK